MEPSQRSDLSQAVGRSSGSFELVLGAAVLALVGLLVDRGAGTMPVFTLGLAALGFAGATLSIYYRYKASMTAHQTDSWTAPRPNGSGPAS